MIIVYSVNFGGSQQRFEVSLSLFPGSCSTLPSFFHFKKWSPLHFLGYNRWLAQSFFNYTTVCLTTPDLNNKYFSHAYESFLYSNLRVRFVYMHKLQIYFQEGWKFCPCGSSSWVISLILHISCVFFFRGAQFTFNLCVFLVRFCFELTQRQIRRSSPCSDAALAVSSAHGGSSLLSALTKNRCPSFQTQIYLWFMSCSRCTPCRWCICGGRSGMESSCV